MSFDPRTIGTPVYTALNNLYERYKDDENRLKQQKRQAAELYTYLATWGMMRLKAEEKALKDQAGKIDVVAAYFNCLERISGQSALSGDIGLDTLKTLGTEDYLGLTGLGLTIAQEFSFWTTAIYVGVEEAN
ncbi:MAG: hypothetical protein AAGG51_27060 [Cyanobacteria bacterium P01_G01_bin.54]